MKTEAARTPHERSLGTLLCGGEEQDREEFPAHASDDFRSATLAGQGGGVASLRAGGGGGAPTRVRATQAALGHPQRIGVACSHENGRNSNSVSGGRGSRVDSTSAGELR